MEHLKSMLSADRMLFTFVYFGSMFLTLFFTFSFGGISGYLMVISASAAQLVALLWYLISFLPGGAAGLQYVFAAMAHILKPVIVVCTRAQAACLSHCLTWMANRGISSWTGASNGSGST
jgi:Got1/Sft2-like family